MISREALLLKVFCEMFCRKSLVLLIGSVLLFCEINLIARIFFNEIFSKAWDKNTHLALTAWKKKLFHCTHSVSLLCKSSHLRCKIAVLKNFAYHNIHRKTPVLKSLLNKIASLQACFFMAFRKSGTQNSKVGTGTQGPRVKPYGGTLRWDTRVKARRTVFI